MDNLKQCVSFRLPSSDVRKIKLVAERLELEDAIEGADLVLTGEGKVDGQTSFGKTAMGVARRAREAGARTICFGGGVMPEGAEFMHSIGVVTMPVVERPMTMYEIAAAGTAPIVRAAARTASLVGLGSELG